METRLGAYIKVITTQRAASCAINHKGELTRDSGEERRIFVINKTSAGHPISRNITEKIDPKYDFDSLLDYFKNIRSKLFGILSSETYM